MEKTIVYVCMRTEYSYQGFGVRFTYVDKVLLSKKEADYYVWQKNKGDHRSFTKWEIQEVEIEKITYDEKLYKLFAKEKTQEINKEIEARRACLDGDSRTISELETKLNSY